MFRYIDENLNKILKSPESVLFIRPLDVGKKKALFAIVKEDEGIYRHIQITKEMSNSNFPFDPIYLLYNDRGDELLKNFIKPTCDSDLALNIHHLEGFKIVKLEQYKILNIGIYAIFEDGTATFVTRERKKYFQKHGGIKPYVRSLEKYDEYIPQHDMYYCIEHHYLKDNIYVVPELLHKENEQSKAKTIGIKTRK